MICEYCGCKCEVLYDNLCDVCNTQLMFEEIEEYEEMMETINNKEINNEL